MEEAIYNRVPLIGMPFFFDQEMNVNLMVHHGIGVKVDLHKVTKSDLKAKIFDVVRNKKYHRKISEVRDFILDQPMTGLEKAVWWTEYVIRHKGAKYFRSPLLDTPSYQYFLMDIIVFVGLALFLILGIFLSLFVLLKPALLQVIKYLFLGDEKKLKAM
ncbi:UDP-glucuronosyltransferase 2B1-like [Agrilus planipennis]|uniref:UDP-glucuronosyltransferase 2B1-like n=1 Tax=Agrilus planipennis TaxID=224129 RepID=A0A7F5RCD4_AGRPL|nr:UDP-glucuronosyltransferase 2B1-like [Agrilus planipennis]